MRTDRNLGGLVRLVYDAAYDERTWHDVFAAVAAQAGATAAGFICVNPQATAASSFSGLPRSAIVEYEEHFASRNEWARRAAHTTAGSIVPDVALLPMSQLRRTEWYSDYLRKYDVARSIGACILSGDTGAYLTLMKPEQWGDWSHDTEQLLRDLMPHLQAAITLHQQLSIVAHRVDTYREVTDAAGLGAIAVDASQRILFANTHARRLLDRQDGVTQRDGRLEAAHREDRTTLRRLLHDARSSVIAAVHAGPLSIDIRRPFGRLPLGVIAAPPPSSYPAVPTARALTLLFIIDRESSPAVSVLAAAYGLTPAEARVVSLLVAGRPTSEIAARTHTSPETVRKHLKTIFRKTDTAGQPELVWLARSLPAVAGGSDA
jgi:DNA-binding CsgD family transcriptional regulator